jgi:sugar (pentulose or hexulose) kinase
MLGALAAGIYRDVTEVSQRMVALQAPSRPDPALAATYDRAFERYVALYPRLRDLFA